MKKLLYLSIITILCMANIMNAQKTIETSGTLKIKNSTGQPLKVKKWANHTENITINNNDFGQLSYDKGLAMLIFNDGRRELKGKALVEFINRYGRTNCQNDRYIDVTKFYDLEVICK